MAVEYSSSQSGPAESQCHLLNAALPLLGSNSLNPWSTSCLESRGTDDSGHDWRHGHGSGSRQVHTRLSRLSRLSRLQHDFESPVTRRASRMFRNAARHLHGSDRFVIELWVPELQKLPPGQQATVFQSEWGYVGL